MSGQGAGAYIEMSGTSMSTAVVSGALALLLDARPSLTPAQAKAGAAGDELAGCRARG